jgi:pimeloyl-ACP methyl ester carboxylesterase
MSFVKPDLNYVIRQSTLWIVGCLLLLVQAVQITSAESGYMKTSDGQSIYYEVAGSGTPLLLIHGGDCVKCYSGSSYSASTFKASASWDAQFNEFAKTFKVIRFDIRGFGKSSKVKPHPIDSWKWGSKADRTTVDAVELMNYLKVTKAHVVGLSIGSAIAAQLAVYYPKMVDRLVLASPWNGRTFHFTSKEASSLNLFLSKTSLILGSTDSPAKDEADYAKKTFSYSPTRTSIKGGHFCNSDSPSDFNKSVLSFLPKSTSIPAMTGGPTTVTVFPGPQSGYWQTSKATAISTAKQQNKLILLVAGRDSCGNTNAMKKIIETEIGWLWNSFILWYSNVDSSTEWQTYASGITGSFSLPLIAAINPNSSEQYLDRSTGVQSQSEFVSRLKKHIANPTATPPTLTLKEKVEKLFDVMEPVLEIPHQTTQVSGSGNSMAYYRIYYSSDMLYVSASNTSLYYAEYIGNKWNYTLLTNTIEEANNKFCEGKCWNSTAPYTPPKTPVSSGCVR